MIRARVLFEPRDLWVGAYWRHDTVLDLERIRGMQDRGDLPPPVIHELTIYVCIVPVLPLRLEMTWRGRLA